MASDSVVIELYATVQWTQSELFLAGISKNKTKEKCAHLPRIITQIATARSLEQIGASIDIVHSPRNPPYAPSKTLPPSILLIIFIPPVARILKQTIAAAYFMVVIGP